MNLRQRNWRTLFVAWAAAMRGRPYQWGATDCATLVRSAWATQFGREMLPSLPVWRTWREAYRVWSGLGPDPIPGIMARAGARVLLPNRTRGCWPLGTVLLFSPSHGLLPSFALAVHPGVLLRSEPVTGVCWVDATTVEPPIAAWVLEHDGAPV